MTGSSLGINASMTQLIVRAKVTVMLSCQYGTNSEKCLQPLVEFMPQTIKEVLKAKKGPTWYSQGVPDKVAGESMSSIALANTVYIYSLYRLGWNITKMAGHVKGIWVEAPSNCEAKYWIHISYCF